MVTKMVVEVVVVVAVIMIEVSLVVRVVVVVVVVFSLLVVVRVVVVVSVIMVVVVCYGSSLYLTLGDHVLESSSLVGQGGGDESGPGEGQILQRGQTHTGDDGQKSRIHNRVVNVLQKEDTQTHRILIHIMYIL